MRIKAKRTRLANVSNKRAGVPRSSGVTLVHPPYDWEREEREDLENQNGSEPCAEITIRRLDVQ